MKIAFTGHRPNKLNNDYDLKSELVQRIEKEIINLLATFVAETNGQPEPRITLIIGMALGIDTLAAKIAVSHNIPFIAAIPFKGQERMWPNKSQNIYFELLQKAQCIRICDLHDPNYPDCTYSWLEYQKLTQTPFTADKMDKRNKWVVNNCDKLIAVWDSTSGGTANCVRYANSKGFTIENGLLYHIDPNVIRREILVKQAEEYSKKESK